MRKLCKSSIEGVSTIGQGRRLYIPRNLRNIQNGLWQNRDEPYDLCNVRIGKEVCIFLSPSQDPWDEENITGTIDRQWRIMLPRELMELANIKVFKKVALCVVLEGIEIWNMETWQKLRYQYCVMNRYWTRKIMGGFSRVHGHVFCRNKSLVTKTIRDSWQTRYEPPEKFCILEFPTKCFLVTPEFVSLKRLSFNRIEETLRFCDPDFRFGVPSEIENVELRKNEAIITYQEVSRKILGRFEKMADGVYILKELVEKEN
jgi:bifunctional DNA-binding transcriptional regulator/antitoxin component of YhaV-PrlF toxin-antitoxin module